MGLFSFSSVLASSFLVGFGLLLVLIMGLLGGGSFVVEWVLGVNIMYDLSFPMMFDWMSLLFSLVVVFISVLVLLFSTSYMGGEKNLSRFVWLVMLFVLSMNFLVYSPSLLGMVLGWDGLGLISFILVIYYQNSKSLGAGLVTAFMNRVGDALMLLSVSLLSAVGHWYVWDFSEGLVGLVSLFVVVLSMTKSAQMPFSYWLPAAMSAPTPVSALVHSSTLVTAGVYLLIRVIPGMGFEVGSGSMMVLLVFSLVTTVMAGFGACLEVDLKKVVALSTLSQLGVMMFSLSMGRYDLAFFHLVSHAMFKALLFVSVGRVIHGFDDSQELRNISGLWVSMPLTSGCLVLASMSLMGLPFLSGFYSKDLIVEIVCSVEANMVVLFMIVLGVVSTVLYSIRFFLCSVWGKLNSGSIQLVEDETMYEIIPSFGLGVGAVVGGCFMQSCLFEFNEVFIMEVGFKIIVLLVLFFGFLVMGFYVVMSKVLEVYLGLGMVDKLFKFMKLFFVQMWFFSYVVYGSNVIGLGVGHLMYKEVDLGWNERVLGGEGVFEFFFVGGLSVIKQYQMMLGVGLGFGCITMMVVVGFSYLW